MDTAMDTRRHRLTTGHTMVVSLDCCPPRRRITVAGLGVCWVVARLRIMVITATMATTVITDMGTDMVGGKWLIWDGTVKDDYFGS